jgi:amidase
MNAKRPANELGVIGAAQAIRAGKLRSIDIVEACVERIGLREDVVGAWTHLDAAAARAAANARDRERVSGLLHGIPLAVKDIIDTVDMPTEYGSPIYRGRRPTRDAACVARAKRAGAVILGKTVTTEFAYFAPGKTANPCNPAHTLGGSSSGTAAGVADRMVPAGFGTQTAASVTRPASFCGVVGYKPSFGSFDLTGIKPFADSFDTLGTITRNAADARYLRCALQGEAFEVLSAMRAPRIGFCRTPWWSDADDDCRVAVEEAARRLGASCATVADVTLPASFLALADLHRSIIAYE